MTCIYDKLCFLQSIHSYIASHWLSKSISHFLSERSITRLFFLTSNSRSTWVVNIWTVKDILYVLSFLNKYINMLWWGINMYIEKGLNNTQNIDSLSICQRMSNYNYKWISLMKVRSFYWRSQKALQICAHYTNISQTNICNVLKRAWIWCFVLHLLSKLQ